MTRPRIFLLPFLLVACAVLPASCRSARIRIVPNAFTATETAPSQFTVKLESDEIRTAEEAEANLLVHAARFTIDHGGFYFTIADRVVGSEAEFNVSKQSEEQSGAGVPTVTSSASGGYSTSTSASRTTTRSIRATLHLYRDRPEAYSGTIYEAVKVLDRYRGDL